MKRLQILNFVHKLIWGKALAYTDQPFSVPCARPQNIVKVKMVLNGPIN